MDKSKLYETLFDLALTGDPDGGGLLAYGYVSGEHITHFEEGRPMFVRSSSSNFNLANFMRVQLFTALGALRTGLNILFEKGVRPSRSNSWPRQFSRPAKWDKKSWLRPSMFPCR